MKNYTDITKVVHKDGYIFIAIFCVVTFIFCSINSNLGWICLILTCLCIYFFRNPDRVIPIDDNLVVSPADGIIVAITQQALPPAELSMNEEMLKISIFLGVLNVHVNRVPATGKVLALHYNPGKFLNASTDKSSIYNERQSVVLETNSGQKVIFVQIAGLIARRIVCDLEDGMEVKSGQRYGLIRFGSRVDLYLPSTALLNVAQGQSVIAGETVIASFSSDKIGPQKFEIR